ncbi:MULTISPECIES: hypothetical protein [Pseudomonas]|jgi:hypothetical protein|uniref:Uncharacterized protein n=2 Tax=Pseudomonas putida TaxID=303 RepID=A0A379KL34_PSEPU|nr:MULTISPECIES: hypothetical protein [Pseudomonas]QPN44200.1 hypothetical protein I5S86_22060 [Priestia aryabhattai]KAF1309244.1 hypothetical protein BLX42_20415 [Pseudomonas sp. SG-MS2]MBG6126787.1 hypothetical protein [Pseudomonas sp. M2]MBM7397223.1 hypothetical protein [Pseudomonas sp. M5]MDH1573588.1 hypothetical protein [Pseudomonas sp. GD03746]
MKLDKPAAIARRNEALAKPVLTSANTLFAILDPKRNLWWFEVPVALLRKGQPDWVNLLLHTPESDELQHLKVPTNFLKAHQEQMEVRNAGKRRSTISLALSADRDSLLRDTRPGGEQLDFSTFVQA